ncbi:hypothetical protein BX666DRAFT_186831 [Dichotomocladium elegans]|nr:hypothetical protein BX666DRAFT_186831 [Dichotomocladium elegans]
MSTDTGQLGSCLMERRPNAASKHINLYSSDPSGAGHVLFGKEDQQKGLSALKSDGSICALRDKYADARHQLYFICWAKKAAVVDSSYFLLSSFFSLPFLPRHRVTPFIWTGCTDHITVCNPSLLTLTHRIFIPKIITPSPLQSVTSRSASLSLFCFLPVTLLFFWYLFLARALYLVPPVITCNLLILCCNQLLFFFLSSPYVHRELTFPLI